MRAKKAPPPPYIVIESSGLHRRHWMTFCLSYHKRLHILIYHISHRAKRDQNIHLFEKSLETQTRQLEGEFQLNTKLCTYMDCTVKARTEDYSKYNGKEIMAGRDFLCAQDSF